MKRILASELKEHAGKEVMLEGWLHKRRDLGAMVFVVLRDRSGLAQVIIKGEAEQAKLEGLYAGTVLRITGRSHEEPRAHGGAELHEPKLEVLVPVAEVSPVEIDKPIDHNSENFDTLFENRAVDLRNMQEQGIFKVQAAVGEAFRGYFRELDFTEIHTPKLLSGATEGGAEVFKMDYFGQTATLAQSPQFYKQMMVGVFERVFETGPVYRAEPSVTTRHMSEYISLDAEMGFVDFAGLLETISGLLNYVCDGVWHEAGAELKAWDAKRPVLKEQLPQVTMAEAHRLFHEATGEDHRDELDLVPAEERWLCEYAAAELGSEAVFVTEWPVGDMKFYHQVDPDKPSVALRADLLFRGVEIVTASMREHRYEVLLEQLAKTGGDPEADGFRYYLSAFKYGLPPHGGMGMGLERVTQLLLGLSNVKEAALFPRDTKRLTP
jgi:nondiscriminating aspartyl-tRNA synthetase